MPAPSVPGGAVVLRTGPIGAGKTTVARELVASAAAPAAYIEGDAFWPFFVKPPTEAAPGEMMRVIVPAMIAASRPIARAGFEVLVDFSVAPGFLPGIVKRLVDSPLHLVVLRPPEAVCVARAAGRSAGRLAEYTKFHDFYGLFESFDPRYVVPAELGDARATAAPIRSGLAAGAYRYPPP